MGTIDSAAAIDSDIGNSSTLYEDDAVLKREIFDGWRCGSLGCYYF